MSSSSSQNESSCDPLLFFSWLQESREVLPIILAGRSLAANSSDQFIGRAKSISHMSKKSHETSVLSGLTFAYILSSPLPYIMILFGKNEINSGAFIFKNQVLWPQSCRYVCFLFITLFVFTCLSSALWETVKLTIVWHRWCHGDDLENSLGYWGTRSLRPGEVQILCFVFFVVVGSTQILLLCIFAQSRALWFWVHLLC